jgi:hypothetical protein
MRSSLRRLLAPTVQIAMASVAGLGLRLFLVLRFPAGAGDSAIYEEFARNWVTDHIYGLYFANGLLPSDMRPPGYPAFLALLYLLFRRDGAVIVLSQAVLDMGTCYLIAWLAGRLVAKPYRSRISLIALWLAATCPFVANYAAVPLTEVLATFLTAAALIALTAAFAHMERSGINLNGGPHAGVTGWWKNVWVHLWDQTWDQTRDQTSREWFFGGLLAGFGALVRPETPLVLAAAGVLMLVLAIHGRRSADWGGWGKLLRAGALMAAGLTIPLIPWAVRNWVDFREVQFLAPRFAASPDEYTPRGLYAWTGTWLVRYRDVYLVPWNVDSGRIEINDIPAAAFDSAQEHARVAELLDRYNATLRMTPEVDQGFARLARERTVRHPLRTYLRVPLARIATLWFTPRTELLPITGHLWPVREQWRSDPADYSVTVLLGTLNFFYVGLAVAGVARALRLDADADASSVAGPTARQAPVARTAIAFLATFVVLRTLFLSTVETPEPRYVLECFPAILAVGALAWLPRRGSKETAAGAG